jgi:ABC-type multidrug transport system ATPase subunit
MDQSALIELTGFGKRYGRAVAVRDLTLRVAHGQLYGLIGADGAGKSSVMKAVAGVLSFEQGRLRVFGTELDTERNAEPLKARLGFMPQGLGLNLYPTLSVEENIDFFAQLRLVAPAALRTRKEALLAMTRLAPFRTRAMKDLSGGMKQKLGLICTLIHQPELIVLDEPTTGVDPVSRRDFWLILSQLIRQEALTALVSTAYLDEASRFDRLALMHEGRVLAEGEPEPLVQQAAARVVRVQAQRGARDALLARFAQVEFRADEARVYVECDDDALALQHVCEALAPAAPRSPRVQAPDLEDVFVALLRARESAPRPPPPRRDTTPQLTVAAEAADADAADADADVHAIDASDLTRDFGTFRAVDRASFAVHYGEIFGLLGANGAGKTTVIKMLTGILPPSSGVGRVAGADMRQAGQTIKERVGYMSQAFSLYTDLTVIENLLLFAGVYGLERRVAEQRARWVVELGGLEGLERAATGRLPMGLRQRLALGCALIHRPRVLFLDEPTSGVDPVGRRRFWDILRALAYDDGVAILLTTHHMREADLCDRLALMFAGRVVADATPAQMKAAFTEERGQLLEVSADQPQRALAALRDAGFAEAAQHGRQLHVTVHDRTAATARIREALALSGLAGTRIVPQEPTMEDVFVHRVLALEAFQREGRAEASA